LFSCVCSSLFISSALFFFSSPAHHRDLHSFPTRRSSDLYGIMALFLPESPRYLIRRNQLDRASKVLYEYTGEPDVNLKIEQIRTTLEREDSESLRDLVGERFGLKPIVWLGILLSLFQQLVGINVIFYYSTTLWQ